MCQRQGDGSVDTLSDDTRGRFSCVDYVKGTVLLTHSQNDDKHMCQGDCKTGDGSVDTLLDYCVKGTVLLTRSRRQKGTYLFCQLFDTASQAFPPVQLGRRINKTQGDGSLVSLKRQPFLCV